MPIRSIAAVCTILMFSGYAFAGGKYGFDGPSVGATPNNGYNSGRDGFGNTGSMLGGKDPVLALPIIMAVAQVAAVSKVAVEVPAGVAADTTC